jgi:Homing endonuclease associated repeat/HNH endonuclease
MKFELTDLRKQISDIEIINDLRSVANNLGKKSLKQRDYSKVNGAKYGIQTPTDRFGNWKSALEKAGLETEKSIHGIEYGEISIREDLLIDSMVKVANKLNNPKFTAKDYDKHGQYSSRTILKRFGSWNKAKQKANLEINRVYNTTTEEYLQNILEMWTHLGRQPKYGEVTSPFSKYHVSSYERKFGSWGAALKEFIEYVNSEDNDEEIVDSDISLTPINISTDNPKETQKEIKRKRTPRGINLRLRWTILKRDNFSCKKCGRSPAKDQSIILHVDHIIPWSKDGETVVDNLETLCEGCNLGKSNLL